MYQDCFFILLQGKLQTHKFTQAQFNTHKFYFLQMDRALTSLNISRVQHTICPDDGILPTGCPLISGDTLWDSSDSWKSELDKM
jgi:hypothetical protein